MCYKKKARTNKYTSRITTDEGREAIDKRRFTESSGCDQPAQLMSALETP